MEFVTLTDLEGRRARAELLSRGNRQRRLRLESGQTLSLSEDALVKQHTGDYYLLLTLTELNALADTVPERAGGMDESDTQRNAESSTEGDTSSDAAENIIIPVAEERIVVHKRQVEGATTRIVKRVLEDTQTVDETLLGEEVEIKRVKVDREVEAAEPIRTEGDTTIIPLYEEVIVIEKRLVLAEELHVMKKQTEKHEPLQVTLRREEVSVERLDPEEVAEQDELT